MVVAKPRKRKVSARQAARLTMPRQIEILRLGIENARLALFKTEKRNAVEARTLEILDNTLREERLLISETTKELQALKNFRPDYDDEAAPGDFARWAALIMGPHAKPRMKN